MWLNRYTIGAAGALLLVVGFWGTYAAGVSNGREAERDAQVRARATALTKVLADHSAELRRRGWQDAEEVKTQREVQAGLNRRITELMSIPPKTLIKTVRVKDESGCETAVTNLDGAFWLRYRDAAGDRAEADPAAASAVPSAMR